MSPWWIPENASKSTHSKRGKIFEGGTTLQQQELAGVLGGAGQNSVLWSIVMKLA
jgi:hypothetical protein